MDVLHVIAAISNGDSNMDESSSVKPEAVPGSPSYEAPQIETVVTPSDIEREVHYAGFPISQVRN